jgi:eukaryotic-like serine/threonine-protein kinase
VDGVEANACPRCGLSFADLPFCPNDGALRMAGALFGDRYSLETLLGAGGMGFVFAARHSLLGRSVAVKVLRSDRSADVDQVSRFLREAQLCSQIRHENIVDVIDFGRDARTGHLYLVMELLSGTTLASEIAREGHLSVKRSTATHRIHPL